MSLHDQIMNMEGRTPSFAAGYPGGTKLYQEGHRDARHAAAELALKADACIEALRRLLAAGNVFMSFSGEEPAWHVKSTPRDEDLSRAREALAQLDTMTP